MSLRQWSGAAPAKVNLRLVVFGREASGYHRIATVFQLLELADRLELEAGEGDGVELELTGVQRGALGPPEENLAVRAARAFNGALSARGRRPLGVRIALRKNVPHGAGLGGGSSDAAAVLRGMSRLSGHPLSGVELMRIGATLGSDVPFFVSRASRALGTGRGERILPLEPLPTREVVLALPAERVSTPWAYGRLARARAGAERSAREYTPRPPSGCWSGVAADAVNDFEAVLFPLRPDLAEIRGPLAAAGARPALLSGTGSALFGIFGSEAEASAAERDLAGVRAVHQLIRTRTRDPAHG